MERIGRTQAAARSTRFALRAARGEYASFQIIISAAAQPLTNVTVGAAGFVSSTGRISPAAVRLYRERYIQVTDPSPDPGWGNRPLGAGWYPDALIPLPNQSQLPQGESFTVDAGTNQPVWVDLRVPRDAAAGTYEGEVQVATDQGAREVSVSLRVWSFELPLTPTLKSSFGMHEPALTDRRMHELLLEHRVMPESVNPEDAAELMERYGLNTTGLRFWSHFSKRDCTMDPPPTPDTLRAALRTYPEGLDIHLYSADEIDVCPRVFETVRRWGAALHAANPRLRNLVTVAPQQPLFSDGGASGRSGVDIWPLLPKLWDRDAEGIAQARKNGTEIWAYTALVQDGYSPKWEIDFAPINYRIFPGFLAQSMDLAGILYWRVELWTDHPFEDLRGYSIERHFYPGEGMLVYPAPAGRGEAIPSMRLKWIRQGVQDYEYVAILKRLGREQWAMKRTRRIADNWQRWTHDPVLLDEVREQMGDEIERLSTSQAGSKIAAGTHS
jgi:hypothetical protein